MPPATASRTGLEPSLRTMLHHPAQASRARHGFTLLELVASLALIALVASFAISAFFAQSDMTLHNALQRLADDIHEMQARATSLQAPVEIVFDPSGDGYHAEDRGTPDPRRARMFPLVSRCYSTDAVFEGVRILTVRLKGTDRISFDASGHSPATGAVVIGYRDDARTLELRSDRGLTYLPDSPRNRGWLNVLR